MCDDERQQAINDKYSAMVMARRARRRHTLALDLGLKDHAKKIAQEVEYWDNQLADAMITIERRFGIFS